MDIPQKLNFQSFWSQKLFLIETKLSHETKAYLFTLEPFDLGFRFTTVLDVEGDHLSLLDDHALQAFADDEWFDCKEKPSQKPVSDKHII